MTRSRRAPLTLLTLLLALALAVPALAGPRRNKIEAARDRAEVADDRRDGRDDLRDMARLNSLVDEWHAARSAGDKAAEAEVDERLAAWIRGELLENQHEVREGQREVARSAGEVRSSRVERKSDVERGRPVAAADDRRDLRDDRRDLADDRRDVVVDRADRTKTQVVAAQLKDLQPSFSSGKATVEQYARKSALLRQLQTMARAEVARDLHELREDKGEVREDRRERREDRRQR